MPNSSATQRKSWAEHIIERNLSIRELSELLKLEYKIASRFLWLLSDVGELNQAKLKADLVFLFDLCSSLAHIRSEASFANYWLICGVPIEKEAEYIDHLFKWLKSNETNITAKSRSLFVLFELTKKYPELKNELKLVVLDQIEINSEDFKKRAKKVLTQLEK